MVHPDGRSFLRFVSSEGFYQFKVLFFGLTTSLQIFSQGMDPASMVLHISVIYLRIRISSQSLEPSSFWRKLRSSSLPNSVGSRGQTQDILQDSTVAVFSDNVTIPKGILGCLKVLEDSLFLGSCSKIRLFPPFLTSPSGHQQAQKLVQSPFYTDLSVLV